jgi:PRC-barrel domain
MSKAYFSTIVAVLSFLGVAPAHAQQTTPDRPPASEPEADADRSPPGATPADVDEQTTPVQAQDPRPSPSVIESTAADRSPPPGKTPTGPAQPEIVGTAIVTPSNVPIGKVVDVVFDATQQPAFVVINSGGQSTAVPYAVAHALRSADKIVIDQSRLQAAPKLKEGEWRSEAGSWKEDAVRFWNRG